MDGSAVQWMNACKYLKPIRAKSDQVTRDLSGGKKHTHKKQAFIQVFSSSDLLAVATVVHHCESIVEHF